MVKVNLPKVEEKTRSELNIIKARRMDKDLNETLQFLIMLDRENSILGDFKEFLGSLIKHSWEQTEEEIDQLEVPQEPIREFLKRFAKDREENNKKREEARIREDELILLDNLKRKYEGKNDE